MNPTKAGDGLICTNNDLQNSTWRTKCSGFAYITKSNDNININSRIELQTDKQTLKQMLRIRLHKPYLNENLL
jgi:hypothetical protein